MKTKFLATASLIALVSAAPAMAGTAKTEDSATKEVTQEVKDGWEKTKKAVKETAEDASDAAQDAYQDIKAFIFSEDDSELNVEDAKINTRTTATGIIGEPAYNFKDERVGVIKDVIIDDAGNAMMVVVGDGDFFGLGKLAAFDYDSMVKTSPDGDIVMPLTEMAIERAAEFSYDTETAGDNVKLMPSSGYSVEKLLDAELASASGETLGDIDDITFKNGKASHLIIGVDKVLGFGGEDLSMPYDAAKLVRIDEAYKYELPAKKASLITNYKSSNMN